jgi:hypothetical protein
MPKDNHSKHFFHNLYPTITIFRYLLKLVMEFIMFREVIIMVPIIIKHFITKELIVINLLIKFKMELIIIFIVIVVIIIELLMFHL